MKLSTSIFLSLITTAVVVGLISLIVYNEFKEPSRGGDFELVGAQGGWKLSEHSKELNVLYFGYTKCPDVCPLTLSKTAQAFSKLTDAEKKAVQVVFINVDHAHETAQGAEFYASQFQKDFVGLTGSAEALDQVLSLYGASYMLEPNPQSTLGYSISHTDRLFFTDKNGHVVSEISQPRNPEFILSTIRSQL